jgi:hypothetical protein
MLKEYDIGWGPQWPMKRLEQKLLKARLSQFYTDDSRSVIINSVWYSGDYHQQVMIELRDLKPTHVFVVAMLDPPIVKLDWFDELGCEVRGVGYYPGQDFIDFFAVFMNEFHQPVDTNLLLDAANIDTAYMCLNRKPHAHRQRLYHALQDAALLDKGFVSMGGQPPLRLLSTNDPGQDVAPNPGPNQYGINNDVASLGNVDRWQQHFLNIVTETLWDCEPSDFLSEKTFKPVLGLRPFLIYAPNGAIQCLKNRGFESFVDDFSDITDADLTQPYNLPVLLQELCQQPKTYWQMKFVELREKLVYNQQQFKKIVELNTQ